VGFGDSEMKLEADEYFDVYYCLLNIYIWVLPGTSMVSSIVLIC
jgi:hypothetical protein